MAGCRTGRGFINSLINKLPVELHIPGYQYCGPGTKLERRLARGDRGVNQLDAACKQHDIAYSKFKDVENRHLADKELQDRAWHLVKASDSSLGEKTSALAVASAMKIKRKLGMGAAGARQIKKKKKMRKRTCSFRGGVLTPIRNNIKDVKDSLNLHNLIKTSLSAAKKAVKVIGGRKKIRIPRIIPIPKVGGFLPFLIPLFAGLSAAGALAGGASGIAKAVNDASAAKKQLEENQRHNVAMEAVVLGKKGSSLYLQPRKKGFALYLKPYSPSLSKNR